MYKLSQELVAFAIIGVSLFILGYIIEICAKYIKKVKKDIFGEDSEVTKKEYFMLIFRLFYPKINHKKKFNRAVTVIGVVTISMFFIFALIHDTLNGKTAIREFFDIGSMFFLFVGIAYFPVIQRVIYFVKYGGEKWKWNLLISKTKKKD